MDNTKDMARSVRRHHNARLKIARINYWGFEGKLNARQLGIALASPACCSCYMCGNPRKWQRELTLQEQLWHQCRVELRSLED